MITYIECGWSNDWLPFVFQFLQLSVVSRLGTVYYRRLIARHCTFQYNSYLNLLLLIPTH